MVRSMIGRSTRVALTAAAVALAPRAVDAAPAQPPVNVGWIELSGSPRERAGAFDWLLGPDANPTLHDLVAMIHDAAARDDLAALFLRLKDAQLDLAQVEELGDAIRRVRAAGKPVIVYGEVLGPAELLLGAHADELLVQSGGMISFPGLYSQEWYLADLFHWIGIDPQIEQIGAYKGANETLMRNAPSPEWEANISQLLDGLYAHLRGTLMRGRNLSEPELDHALEEAWAADPPTAARLGLIDGDIDLPSVFDHLGQRLGGQIQPVESLGPAGAPSPFDLSGGFFALFQALTASPQRRITRDTIAIVHIDGPIVHGDSTEGGLFGGTAVGSRTIRNVLEDLLDEPRVRGVIVRINSPGGSAIGSEVIWQGLRRVAESRPVWVSVGSMAASGGYYIAVGGDRIYVDRSSIVGSIGVVGGKLAIGGLLDKLHIRPYERFRGPRAELLSLTRPWTDTQREQIRSRMRDTYDLFVSRVRAGRPQLDLSTTAEGRLFTGTRAVRLGLADRLGGLHDAVADMADELGLVDYDVRDFPGPKSLQELFDELFSARLHAPLATSRTPHELALLLEQLVGTRSWPLVRDALVALWQLHREPVLLVAPTVITFR